MSCIIGMDTITKLIRHQIKLNNMKKKITKELLSLFTLLFILGGCTNNSTTKAPDTDKFVGAWSSETEGGEPKPNSIYIDKIGEIYNCYFINSKGESKQYKGIIDQDNLKIGNDFTIKYLVENKCLYLVENSIQYVKMKSILEMLNEMKQDIKEVDGSNLSNFIYLPFSDDMANAYNETPNFSIKQRGNISEGVAKIFDKKVKEAFLSPNLDSYYDLEKDETLIQTMGNYISPWEYVVHCTNTSDRNLTFVFSIRNNEYKAIRIQYFP